MDKFTYTVVIPFYKDKNHLDKILQLLIIQTKIPEEIIVVDDASKEDIKNIIQKYEVTYCRQSKNSGVAAARNKGLQLSSSTITIFLDGDAFPEPTFIQAIDDVYKEVEEGVVGVGGRAIECRISTKFDEWRAIHLSQNFGFTIISKAPFLYGVCCSYKTKTLLEIGGFDPTYNQNVGEDYELGIRLNKLGFRLFYSPNIVVNHQHMDSLETLIRSQYLWSFWGYKANKNAGISKILPWCGHFYRGMRYSLEDLLIHGDLQLFLIGVIVFKNKFKGLLNACRNKKR